MEEKIYLLESQLKSEKTGQNQNLDKLKRQNNEL